MSPAVSMFAKSSDVDRSMPFTPLPLAAAVLAFLTAVAALTLTLAVTTTRLVSAAAATLSPGGSTAVACDVC